MTRGLQLRGSVGKNGMARRTPHFKLKAESTDNLVAFEESILFTLKTLTQQSITSDRTNSLTHCPQKKNSLAHCCKDGHQLAWDLEK